MLCTIAIVYSILIKQFVYKKTCQLDFTSRKQNVFLKMYYLFLLFKILLKLFHLIQVYRFLYFLFMFFQRRAAPLFLLCCILGQQSQSYLVCKLSGLSIQVNTLHAIILFRISSLCSMDLGHAVSLFA